MASQTIIRLLDDTDGTDASETVTFALDGVSYEIDLNETNANALRQTLAPWAAHGRRTHSSTSTTRRTLKPVGDSRSALIRAWAARAGLQVPARGRIPNDVQRQYDAAH